MFVCEYTCVNAECVNFMNPLSTFQKGTCYMVFGEVTLFMLGIFDGSNNNSDDGLNFIHST